MLSQMRSLSKACSRRQQYSTAAWYAEKAVSLSTSLMVLTSSTSTSSSLPSRMWIDNETLNEDIYLYATALFSNSEYARALNVLEHHGLIDVEKQSTKLTKSGESSTTEESSNSSSTTAKALNSTTRAPPQRTITTRSAKAAAESAAAAAAAALLISPSSILSSTQYFGAVKPQSLKFFLLAAQCYRSLKQSETCVMLLESCMEGPGHGGLLVPVAPVSENTYVQLLDLLMNCVKDENTSLSAQDENDETVIPLSSASTSAAKPSTTIKKKSRGGGGGGEHETSGQQDPSETLMSETDRRGGVKSKDLDGKFKVWRIIRDMSLQHNSVTHALSAALRDKKDRENKLAAHRRRRRREEDAENYDPMVTDPITADSRRKKEEIDLGGGSAVTQDADFYDVREFEDRILSYRGGHNGLEEIDENLNLASYCKLLQHDEETSAASNINLESASDTFLQRRKIARLFAAGSEASFDNQITLRVPEGLLSLGADNSNSSSNNSHNSGDKTSVSSINAFGFVPVGEGQTLNIVACLCEQRGLALLATDNRNRAAQWFQAALRIDPYVQGALHALVDNHLLSSTEEEALFAYLASVLDDFEIPPHRTSASLMAQNSMSNAQRQHGVADCTAAMRGFSLGLEPVVPLDSAFSPLGEDAAIADTSSAVGAKGLLTSPDKSINASSAIPTTASPLQSPSHNISIIPASVSKTKSNSRGGGGGSTTSSSLASTPSSTMATRSPRALSGRKTASTSAAAALRASVTESAGVAPPLLQARFSTGLGGSVVGSGGKSNAPPPIPPSGSSAGRALSAPPTPSSPPADKDAAKAAFSAFFPLRATSSTLNDAGKPSSALSSSSSLSISKKAILKRRATGWLLDLYASRMGRYGVQAHINESPVMTSNNVGATTRSSPLASSSFSLHSKFSRLDRLYRLGKSIDVLAAKAESHLCSYDLNQAVILSRQIAMRDPFHVLGLTIHYSCLVRLKRSSELYKCAHNAVEAAPGKALSWYAVGCYYLSLGKCSAAVRNLTRSCQLDGGFAHSWIALGHAYALQDESEPALAAYRTAMRLHPASHTPPLAMVPLMQASGQIALAKQYLELALTRCPHDPLVYHEAGVLEYNAGLYQAAASLFRVAAQSLSQSPHHVRVHFEATYVNLGHSTRKLSKLREAAAAYNVALSLCPGRPSTLAALAFTHQLAGDSERACSLYHAALSKVPEDLFCQRMLRIALEDSLLLQNARVVLLPLGTSAAPISRTVPRTDHDKLNPAPSPFSPRRDGGGRGPEGSLPSMDVQIDDSVSASKNDANARAEGRSQSTVHTPISVAAVVSSSVTAASTTKKQQQQRGHISVAGSGPATSTPEYQRALFLSREHVSAAAASIVSSSSRAAQPIDREREGRESASRRARSAGPGSALATPRIGRGGRGGGGGVGRAESEAVAVSGGGLIFYPGGRVVDHSASALAASTMTTSSSPTLDEPLQTDDDWIAEGDIIDGEGNEGEEEDMDMILDDSDGLVGSGTSPRGLNRSAPPSDESPRRRRNRVSGPASGQSGHRRSSGGGSTSMSTNNGLEVEDEGGSTTLTPNDNTDDEEDEERSEEEVDHNNNDDEEEDDDDNEEEEEGVDMERDNLEGDEEDEEEEAAQLLTNDDDVVSSSIGGTNVPTPQDIASQHLSAVDRLEIASAAAASGGIDADADFAALLQRLEFEAAAEEEEAALLAESQQIDEMDVSETGGANGRGNDGGGGGGAGGGRVWGMD
jgi:tetratricopeptide (TPR) repeat protein